MFIWKVYLSFFLLIALICAESFSLSLHQIWSVQTQQSVQYYGIGAVMPTAASRGRRQGPTLIVWFCHLTGEVL